MRRILVALSLCFLVLPAVLADSIGPNNPGTRADDGSNGGNEAWGSVATIAASDDLYATADCSCVKMGFTLIPDLTHYLKATNFGFAIPADSTVNGVEVEIERRATGSNTNIADDEVRLVVSGTVQGANLAAVGTWLASDIYVQYGSSVELWGASLSPSMVNASNFGVVISARDQASGGSCPNSATAQVDHIRMTIFYTPAAPAPTVMPRRMIHIARSPSVLDCLQRS
jgi:hypothetical protein